MKHNIKLPDGTIKEIDCRIGSGVKDKHGNEIFEGDKVNFELGNDDIRKGLVVFNFYDEGSFSVFYGGDGYFAFDDIREFEIVD